MTDEQSDQDEMVVWVKTAPSEDGKRYLVTLEVGGRRRHLSPLNAVKYAETVLNAAADAEFDAAVFAQIVDLSSAKKPEEVAGYVVTKLREMRPPPNHKATAPLAITPGVSSFTHEPFIMVLIDGRRVGQWSPTDARAHAMHVMESVRVAALDGDYFRVLCKEMGLGEEVARRGVDGLAAFRSRGDDD